MWQLACPHADPSTKHLSTPVRRPSSDLRSVGPQLCPLMPLLIIIYFVIVLATHPSDRCACVRKMCVRACAYVIITPLNRSVHTHTHTRAPQNLRSLHMHCTMFGVVINAGRQAEDGDEARASSRRRARRRDNAAADVVERT